MYKRQIQAALQLRAHKPHPLHFSTSITGLKKEKRATNPTSILSEEQIKEYISICDELGLSALVEAHDAVSYTHLDVYKRQANGLEEGSFNSNGIPFFSTIWLESI